ncbi:SH3R2 ligase, partial [Bucco capensis]|nr:SH3R2 ligase [Bucco capensis]
MDDLALLDLLECPVCFEKLDATAKVLPCQHTFCKPCLQRILKCQKELRCPECRTLVLCSIEQLPSNLLLIRLLDGVRCGQKGSRLGSMPRAGLLASPASLRRLPRALQLQQQRLATTPRMHMEGVPRAKALYTYRGHNPGELRFNKGDIIVLLRQLDEHWFLGELNGLSGVFPASSVQVLQQLPLPQPLGTTLCSFQLRSRDKADKKDSLTFHDVPTALLLGGRRGEEGKAEQPPDMCHLCHRVSFCLFQPNSTARQLLQSSKSHWSPQAKCGSLQPACGQGKAAECPAFAKGPESRRRSLRQFSLTTALNTLNRMVHAPGERQALHISSPVLISSSNPSVPTQASQRPELPCGTPLQVSASYCPTPGALGHPAALVTLPHLQHPISAYMYVRKLSHREEGGGVYSGSMKMSSLGKAGEELPKQCRGGWSQVLPLPSPPGPALKANLSDSKMPSLYASWTLSSSSLSSQGSLAESIPRQSRAPRALLPVPVPSPGRSVASAQPALRRGRGSARKNGSLQRPGQAGTPMQLAGSLRRPPMAAVRPQQLQLYQQLSIPPAASMPEAATRPNLPQEALPALVVRGGESRTPSVCSSVILDAKEPPAKSEAAAKPPASAPPSILVKPDTSRNSAEKQVKTVRFQNHSPPPPKRH